MSLMTLSMLAVLQRNTHKTWTSAKPSSLIHGNLAFYFVKREELDMLAWWKGINIRLLFWNICNFVSWKTMGTNPTLVCGLAYWGNAYFYIFLYSLRNTFYELSLKSTFVLIVRDEKKIIIINLWKSKINVW